MPTINVGPGSGVELQEIADAMGRSRKVVVVTGAGISTNCGIPDFRSENGLYSLIQAQYDAALQNPPWENTDNFDIDDRPKKKRRVTSRWFYEVVREDGTVVDVIDQESGDTHGSQEPRSKSTSRSTSPLSSPLTSLPSSPPDTTTPPSTADESSQSSSRPDLPNLKGRDLFDSMIWKEAFTTSIFYMFITSLRQKTNEVTTPTATHKFLRALRDGGRLVRNYTQNIDGLEAKEGLSTDLSLGTGSKARFSQKVFREPRPDSVELDSSFFGGVECVQLHGSLDQLRCGLCTKLSSWDEERESTTLSGQAPDCPACEDYNARRTGRGRRGLAVGRLRPDIVLYGEEHPKANLVGPLITHDLALGPDVLLILGTSLKVHGLKIIIKEFAKAVHTRGGKVVFVNRTKPPESTWGDIIDYWVSWDCDAWVLDLKERRGDLWLPQGSQLDEPAPRRESSGTKMESKKPANGKKSRPQATRDDRINGVYHTFKILDHLGQILDENGKPTTRTRYWDPPVRRSIAPPPKPEPLRKGTKSAAPSKGTSKTAANTANTNKKRKSYPTAVQDDERNVAFLLTDITNIWENIRKIAPTLPEKPSNAILNSGRMPLATLHANVPAYLKPFSFGLPIGSNSFEKPPNHIPDIPGLAMPNLLTHPPSGATLPLHSPTSNETIMKPPPKPVPPPTNHAYGTRSSRRWSSADTIVVQSTPKQSTRTSWGSTETTIVVDDPGPMTPGSQRIKRMGSIGAILSSPETSLEEVYHDAEESPDVFHDAE